jgi:cytochrome d ubiquinol oxidase subunit I
MAVSVTHMFLATLETSLFVIGGISAWYIINQRNAEFFSKAFKITLIAAIAVAPLQIYVGHLSGEQVYQRQPTKMAAMEALWETIPAGGPGDWSLLAIPNVEAERNDWEIKVPNGLGYILELKKDLSEPVQGLKEYPPEDRPGMVGLVYYSFRTMIAIGFFLAGLMGITVIQWLRGKLSGDAIANQKWLMRGWIFSAPLGYIAVESGWIVRCVGRQPWIVYGEIRTVNAASNLPPADVLGSLTGFAISYTILFIGALYFGSRIIRRGPRLDLPLPGSKVEQPAVDTSPGQFVPDERPVEAQQ